MKIRKIILIFFLCALAFIAYTNFVVIQSARDIYSDTESLPTRDIAMVLGCSKYLKNGKENFYYKNRISAVDHLYRVGKVKKIIVSGDGSKTEGSEPESMAADLILRGVPEKNIIKDYAGLRTLDSVLRCKKIFGMSEPIIVSQHSHCKRALYIASKHDMRAVAFEATDIELISWRLRNIFREVFACTWTWIDVNIRSRKAKYYGAPEKVFDD